MKTDLTHCSICNEPVRLKHNYVAVMAMPGEVFNGNGLTLLPGCGHKPAYFLEDATAILTSKECLLKYVEGWIDSQDARKLS